MTDLVQPPLPPRVRHALPADLPRVAELAAEHADYERAVPPARLLMDAVTAEALALGLDEVQWQTPSWNEGAITFYDRLGASSKERLRFTLRPGTGSAG
ncbi:GNAT family N-acetyltransferase [Streptomyces sp. NBC_01142]|uniref:GNAT family N-acetyltransferase n=1 Tax=Streptomyces sp. NBC_01142 TaxID=2975865 RepID=UPI0022535078|nr:hypothetical protein [Streptomyces sp. NBC_01142]MCX4819308.1 GNAT family N-acetyltransferase [Streptomyces sp. NBC_01142]